MKSADIKNSFLVVLISIMFMSFSSYVLLSTFNIQSEVAASGLSEEDTKAAEEYPKELFVLLQETSYTTPLVTQNVKNEARYEQIKLPIFNIVPSTPPPDLG